MKFTILRNAEGGGEGTTVGATQEAGYNPWLQDHIDGKEVAPAGQVIPENTVIPDGQEAEDIEQTEKVPAGTPIPPAKAKEPPKEEGEEAGEGEVEEEEEEEAPSAEQLAAAQKVLEKMGLKVTPTGAAEPEKREPLAPPSQEEIDKVFNVFKPSKELIADLMSGDEEAITHAIKHVSQATVLQAVTTARAYVQDMLAPLQKELGGYREHVAAQEKEKLRSEFLELWPDATKYEEILQPEYARLAQSGKVMFNNMSEAVAHMRKHVEKVMGKISPGFKLPASVARAVVQNGGGRSTATVKKTAPKMAQASAGGQGGSASGGGAQSQPNPNENPDAVFLFGGKR